MGLEFALLYILMGALIYLVELYFLYKLEKMPFDLRQPKICGAWALMTILGSLINLFLPKTFKIFAIIIMLVSINYIFILRKIEKCITLVLIFEMISMISELIIVVLISTFMGSDSRELADNLIYMFLISIGVPVAIFISIKTKIPYLLYNYLVKTFANVRKHNLLAYFVAIIVLTSVFVVLSYMKLPSQVVLICNSFLIICFVIIVVKLINSQDRNRKITSKYETSIASLKEYEDIMDKYRVTNHENKNQLLTIRNMVKTSDKKTLSYIDKILEHKIRDNEKIFSKTAKIPEGGLRAIIYSKVCRMEELKINYSLDISNDVKSNTLIELDEDTVLNVCKILGVFLDNSIEAVLNLKIKNIFIELFMLENNLCIDITNNYEGVLEVDKISQKKYTTKGKGHGYGLSLVSEIIKSDSNLYNEKVINKDNFTQRLIIKL